jgi:hypothetical protein
VKWLLEQKIKTVKDILIKAEKEAEENWGELDPKKMLSKHPSVEAVKDICKVNSYLRQKREGFVDGVKWLLKIQKKK